MEYNHNRPLEDFQEDLKIIRESGYHPIAVSQIYFEDVYVFETAHEAKEAYEKLEDCDNCQVIAFWYSKEAFLKEVEEYESKDGCYKVLIHWL